MNPSVFGTEELRMLWASALLGVVQLVLAVMFSLAARGLPWGAGPRDTPAAPMSTMGARVERAWHNYRETFPLFAAAVLLANAMSVHGRSTVIAADLFFYGRVLYVPLYAFGIPYLRTVSWLAAVAGIVIILAVIWPGI
jgi:uncharacterized MAPEG superfamily protein